MIRYSLNIARIGRGSGATEGEHDLVNPALFMRAA